MSATIGGLTIPTGWISANDDNFIEWTGMLYNGISFSNVSGKLGVTFTNSLNYNGFELCPYVKLNSTQVGVSGIYKVLSGSGAPGWYTLVLDKPYIAASSSWSINILWEINAQIWGGFLGTPSTNINLAEGVLPMNYNTGVSRLNIREFTRYFFDYTPYVSPYTSGVLTGSAYDRTLYRHLLFNFNGQGAFKQFLQLNSVTFDTLTGYYIFGYVIRLLNSGYTNAQIQQFTTGNRPISDHAPFDDCNSYNLHSYIVGNDVVTVPYGIIPAGVDFDKVDIDLIVY